MKSLNETWTTIIVLLCVSCVSCIQWQPLYILFCEQWYDGLFVNNSATALIIEESTDFLLSLSKDNTVLYNFLSIDFPLY